MEHSSPIQPCLPATLRPLRAHTLPVFEGWYFKVTLPGDGQSFALIYSVEDPAGQGAGPLGAGRHAGVGVQVMGPDDGYLLQYSPEVCVGLRLGDGLGRVVRPAGWAA